MSESRTAASPADAKSKHCRCPVSDVDDSMRKVKINEKDDKEVTVAPRQPPALREGQDTVTSFSTIYKVTVSPKTMVWKYDIMVKVETNTGHIIRLSTGRRDDASRTQRKEVCRAVLKVALKTIVSKDEAYVFDGAKTLFVTGDLYDRLTQLSNVIYLSEADLPTDVKKLLEVVDLREISIEINSPMEGSPSFQLGQFFKARQADDLSNLDRTPLQCLELLTTSPAISSGAFTAIWDRELFPKNIRGKDIGRGQEERLGLIKGIRILEPEEGKPIAAMTVDATVSVFFKAQPLIQTVRELMRWRPEDDNCRFDFEGDAWAKINNYVNGLRVTLSYGPQKYNFIAAGISKIPLKDIVFECQKTGERIYVMDTYTNVLGHWPAVIMKKTVTNRVGEKEEASLHFPLDLLQVAANQLVKWDKESGQKPTPMHIETRFSEIHSMLYKIYGGADASILDAFGVHISGSPMMTEAIRRSLPNVVFRSSKQTANFIGSSSSWKMERNFQYVAASKLTDVVVAHDGTDVQSVQNMINKLSSLAKQLGLKANWHIFATAPGNTLTKIDNLFKSVQEKKKKGDLVLIIYVNSNMESHNILKLKEIQYQIASQQITLEVARNVPSKSNIAFNILHKINAKLGGLNYRIIPDKFSRDSWISNNKSLVIGYDVSHPTGSSGEVYSGKKPPTLPSIIGMSFNGAEHPENFIGDYHYQEPRQEQVTSSILTDRVQWMLALFTKHRELPENIFILRDGVSDGQFKMVVEEEFQAIKRGIDIYKQQKGVKNWTPKFILAIVTKRHNNRFASLNEKDLPVNHVPGTIIDKELVRSDITHFFMISHNVWKGTGKLPSYYILINELKDANNTSQDRLQSFMLGLSFLHQISQNSVSLPEPVYQADQWAKRGKNIWTAYCNENQRLPRLSSWNTRYYSSAPLDFEAMSRMLSYRGTALEQFRTNA